jgi:hypothetical protein
LVSLSLSAFLMLHEYLFPQAGPEIGRHTAINFSVRDVRWIRGVSIESI